MTIGLLTCTRTRTCMQTNVLTLTYIHTHMCTYIYTLTCTFTHNKGREGGREERRKEEQIVQMDGWKEGMRKT